MTTEQRISFFVPGIPAPGGSKKAFVLRKGGVYTGRAVVVEAGGQRTKDWRQACVVIAQQFAPATPLRGPLRVEFEFVMPRIKAHFHTSKARAGALREDAPRWHTVKPDRTKLTRSTEDALKGIIWADDCQIVDGETRKGYGDRPGCSITITPLSEAPLTPTPASATLGEPGIIAGIGAGPTWGSSRAR